MVFFPRNSALYNFHSKMLSPCFHRVTRKGKKQYLDGSNRQAVAVMCVVSRQLLREKKC